MRTQHSYQQLPDAFFRLCEPTPVAAPQWLAFNTELATQLDFPAELAGTDAGLYVLAGNQVPAWASPMAQAYSGHQFGHLSPRLGDGRALLLAEVVDIKGKIFDLQLKGAGPTPFSRRGDGRSALGPVIREYLVSEAMHALGVPTSRALAAVISGEPVVRERLLPGGILCRVASSHLRIGTFQYVGMLNDPAQLAQLVDYALARHYPTALDSANKALALLQQVSQAQAALVAHWMSLGFVHGVMNTDNMSISGETIDYGPCAFLDQYNSATVFSSIDQEGRYAYRNQPAIAQWNLARLAEALLPLLAADEPTAIAVATAELNQFPQRYQQQFNRRMAAKLGLSERVLTAQSDAVAALIQQWLNLLQQQHADFTLSHRQLAATLTDPQHPAGPQQLYGAVEWLAFYQQWQQLLATDAPLEPMQLQQQMQAVNPAFIPRNEQIEAIIHQVLAQQDDSLFQQFARDLTSPFASSADLTRWAQPPSEPGKPYRTFCGT
jgi:uncharacterized protein YdiU (UPF0061 family)